jgi:hypothetical protein
MVAAMMISYQQSGDAANGAAGYLRRPVIREE